MKVGVLGAGSAGMRHIRNAISLGCEVYVWDPQITVTLDGALNATRSDLLRVADVIISATPTPQHMDDLWAAILLKKPCLIEKPIAGMGQSAEVAGALRKADVDKTPVAVGFNLRLHPLVRQAKAIKDPFWISLACCQYSDHKEEGVLNHWASHEIDLAQYIAGPLRLLHAYVSNNSADLEFLTWAAERHVHVHSDMRAHSRLRTATIVSDEHTLVLDLEADPVLDGHYRAELSDFLLWAKNPTSTPWVLATGWDGWQVLKHCERAMYDNGSNHSGSNG